MTRVPHDTYRQRIGVFVEGEPALVGWAFVRNEVINGFSASTAVFCSAFQVVCGDVTHRTSLIGSESGEGSLKINLWSYKENTRESDFVKLFQRRAFDTGRNAYPNHSGVVLRCLWRVIMPFQTLLSIYVALLLI